jgi:hypothetical protein
MARPTTYSPLIIPIVRACATFGASNNISTMTVLPCKCSYCLAQARSAAARQAIVAQANTRARALAPVFAEIRAAGVHSYRGIAVQLNARGIPTARGGRWAATQVRDIVLRSGT